MKSGESLMSRISTIYSRWSEWSVSSYFPVILITNMQRSATKQLHDIIMLQLHVIIMIHDCTWLNDFIGIPYHPVAELLTLVKNNYTSTIKWNIIIFYIYIKCN